MSDIDLQSVLDAAYSAGVDGKAPTAEQRRTAIREAIDGAGRDVVDALQNEAIEKFGELNAGDPTADDELFALEVLTEAVQVTRSVQADMDSAAEEMRARRAELAAEVQGSDEGGQAETPDEGAEGGDESGGGSADLSAVNDGEGAEGGGAAEAQSEGAEGAEGAEGVGEPVGAGAGAVTASARKAPRRFDLSQVKAPAPQPRSEASGPSIVAAANVRGFEPGQNLDMDALTAAAQARIEGMPRGMRDTIVKADIASMRVPYPDALVASGKNDHDVVTYAANPRRLEGGSLLAAGGWCAPSETIYELSPVLADARAGLVDVPDIQVKRGGIRTTEGADYAAIYEGDQVGVTETEAEAIANASDDDYQKVLYRVPCTEFTEVRAGVVYTGIEAGILQNDAYPELTRQHVEVAMTAHAHRVNELTIAKMETLSTAVNLASAVGPSVTCAVLNGLELLIVDYRYRYRAPESMTLEVVLPIWLKLHVRADLALRAGVDCNQVTDAQINAFFTARSAKVQWVYDWQDAFSGVSGGFGSATAKTSFATSVKALVYAAGTFVRGRGEVISLGVTYDSVNIRKNDFLEMFNEEKLLVHRRQYKSLVATLPVSVNGTASLAQKLNTGGVIAS